MFLKNIIAKKYRFLLYFCLILLTTVPNLAVAQNKVRVATGGLLGDYYNIGLKFCRYLIKANKNLQCEIVPTTGSLENLELLRNNSVDFAFSLSNLAFDAYHASGSFVGQEPISHIYQLLKLHQEIFTILVKDETNITDFQQLDSKKISNGPPGSDSSTIYDILLEYYFFQRKPIDIELAHEYYAQEYCGNNIDAIMLMTGHPSFLANLITHKCKSDFLKLDSDKIDLIVKNHPGFRKVTLPAGIYPDIKQDQTTIAVESILLGSTRVDPQIAKNFLEIFPQIVGYFKASHPALYDLDEAEFSKDFVLPNFKEQTINSEKK